MRRARVKYCNLQLSRPGFTLHALARYVHVITQYVPILYTFSIATFTRTPLAYWATFVSGSALRIKGWGRSIGGRVVACLVLFSPPMLRPAHARAIAALLTFFIATTRIDCSFFLLSSEDFVSCSTAAITSAHASVISGILTAYYVRNLTGNSAYYHDKAWHSHSFTKKTLQND